MRRAAIITFTLLPLLAACATTGVRGPVAVVTVEQPAWSIVASAQDHARLDQLPADFAKARAAVPRSRAARVAGEGALVDPAAAQLLPDLPPGPYYCRLVRFGGKAQFATYKPDFCYVEAGPGAGGKGRVAFTKQTANQPGGTLPEGWIYPDDERRQVFLGATRRKGEPGGRRYGDNPDQNVAGVVERVSPFRWRLVLTRAEGGGTLDMYELVPVAPRVPGATAAVPAA